MNVATFCVFRLAVQQKNRPEGMMLAPTRNAAASMGAIPYIHAGNPLIYLLIEMNFKRFFLSTPNFGCSPELMINCMRHSVVLIKAQHSIRGFGGGIKIMTTKTNYDFWLLLFGYFCFWA